jgi:hypothetical protein
MRRGVYLKTMMIISFSTLVVTFFMYSVLKVNIWNSWN